MRSARVLLEPTSNLIIKSKGSLESVPRLFWPISFCLLFRLKWLELTKNVKTPQLPCWRNCKYVDCFYLDAGKLGLKEFCFFVKCLQPAPLSPGSQPQRWGHVNREWEGSERQKKKIFLRISQVYSQRIHALISFLSLFLIIVLFTCSK